MQFRVVCAVIAALAVLVGAGSASAKDAEIYPLSSVRPGQRGYGLSTFSGTEPTRWEFEVVGVMKNFRPKMSIILVKSDDPKVQVSGFWQGMSGSPLFIDGKLACAFSYGFQFNKRAIGGCTPIEFMIEEGLNAPIRAEPVRKKIGRQVGTTAWVRPPAASPREWLDVAPGGSPTAALDRLGQPRQPWLLRAPLPPKQDVGNRAGPGSLVPAAVPLSISGMTSPAFERAKELMKGYPVEPMAAGGTGSPAEGPGKFTLGGPIAVQLVRGDISFAATGTVSYLDRQRVLAFGHPFFEQGEFYAPVTAAQIHTVIPSQVSAFVLASPLRELGSLVQDRLPAIMADTRLRNKMIPMSVFVESPGKNSKSETAEFHTEVVNNRFLTASFAGLIGLNAVTRFLPDRDHATVMIKSRVDIKGRPPLTFTDYLYAGDGAASVIGAARGLRVLVPLLFNPYEPIEIERIRVDMEMSFDTNFGEIVELRTPFPKLVPGQKNYVNVVLRRFDETEVIERIPFDVPRQLAGSIVKLSVTPGDAAPLDIAPPKSLDDLLSAFGKLMPGNVFAVTLSTADQGAGVDGTLIRDLPASAIDRLAVGSRTPSASPYKAVSQSIAPSSRVINGGQSLLIEVADL